MRVGDVHEDLAIPSNALKGLLSVPPVHAQDDKVAPDRLFLGASFGLRPEFVD
jgi:hypothetical protein